MADDVKFNVEVALKGREAFASASGEIKALENQAKQASASVGFGPGSFGLAVEAADLASQVFFKTLRLGVDAIVGVASAISATVVAAADYEKSLAKIQGLTSASKADVDEWRGSLLGLAGEVGKAPKELAEAMYFLAGSGLTGARAMDALTLSAKASAVGMGETNQIAQAMVAIMESYSSTGMTAAHAMDVLTQTVKDGGAEANTLATSLGRVTGIAAAAGVNFEEVGAYIATFTKVIPSAAEAVTSLRALLVGLEKPTEGVKSALGALGISAEDLRKSIKDRGLMVTLQDLFTLTGGNVGKLGELIPNVRAFAGAMVNAGSQGESYTKILDNIYKSAGSLDAAFKITQGTLSWQWSSVTSSFEAMKIAIGEGLIPALAVLATEIGPILKDMMREIGIVFMRNRDIFADIGKVVLPVLLFALSGILIAFGSLLSAGATIVRIFAEQAASVWLLVAAYRALRGDAVGSHQALEKWASANAAIAKAGAGVKEIGEVLKIAGFKAALAAEGVKGFGASTKKGSAESKEFDRILRSLGGSLGGIPKPIEAAVKAAEKLAKIYKKAREEFEKYQKSQGSGVSGSAAHAKALAPRGLVSGGLTGAAGFFGEPSAAEEIANAQAAVEGLALAEQHLNDVNRVTESRLNASAYSAKVFTDQTRQARTMTIDWGSALRQVADLTTALGIKADSSLGRIVSSVALGVAGWMSYRKAQSDAARAQEEYTAAGNKGTSPMAQAITNTQKYTAALGALSAAVAIYQGAQEEADTTTRVATGAMQGAMAGAAFGPYGIAIGAVAGGLIGYFSGPDWAKAIDVAAQDFGFAISDEMAKSIYATAEKLKISVHVAALLSLDKMIAASGGQTSSFGKQIGQLLAQSFAPGSEGAKMWSQTVTNIWKALVDEGTVAGSQLAIGMLQQMRALGQAIPAAISEQIQAGLLKGAEALTKVFEGIPMSAENSAYLFSSTFWAIVKEKGILAAIDAMKPAWDKIAEMMGGEVAEMMGGEGLSGILGAIPELMALADSAMRPVLEGVQALITVSKGLSDAGYMTMGAYQALAGGAQAAYDTLIAGGASEQAALAAIAPLLAEIQRLSEVYGFTIDENTQKLIDQAKANGVAFPTDPLMKVVELLSQIVSLLGGVADEADRAARGIGNIPPPPKGQPGPEGYASGGFVPETWPRGRTIRVAEPGTGGEFMIPANKARGGGQVLEVTVNMQFPFGQLVSVMERAQLANAFRVRPDAVQDFS